MPGFEKLRKPEGVGVPVGQESLLEQILGGYRPLVDYVSALATPDAPEAAATVTPRYAENIMAEAKDYRGANSVNPGDLRYVENWPPRRSLLNRFKRLKRQS